MNNKKVKKMINLNKFVVAFAFFGLSIGAANAQTWNIGAGANPAAVTAILSGTAPNQTCLLHNSAKLQKLF